MSFSEKANGRREGIDGANGPPLLKTQDEALKAISRVKDYKDNPVLVEP